MKSIKWQLLVTLCAVAVATLILAIKGLPPNKHSMRVAYAAIVFDKQVEFDQVDFERCISWGVDINSPGECGHTLLDWAVFWNNPRMVELLLLHGADVNAINSEGLTALNEAYLSEHGTIPRQNYDEFIAVLRKHGVKVAVYDSAGRRVGLEYPPARDRPEKK